jgi:hypothetical protein
MAAEDGGGTIRPEDFITVHGLRFRGRRYVDAFPFAHNVDLDQLEPGEVKVIRAMPRPGNMTVHLANEHGVNPDPFKDDLHRTAWVHMDAHVHGRFRDGAEHWHTGRVA